MATALNKERTQFVPVLFSGLRPGQINETETSIASGSEFIHEL